MKCVKLGTRCVMVNFLKKHCQIIIFLCYLCIPKTFHVSKSGFLVWLFDNLIFGVFLAAKGKEDAITLCASFLKHVGGQLQCYI